MVNHNYSFLDYYHNRVELSLNDMPFSVDARHVWVICRHKQQWLLTKHRDRGLEFPGGKVEPCEDPKEAAIREVFEETGGIVERLSFIGQYRVTAKNDIVIKNIYIAEVSTIKKQQHYFETEGPVLLSELPKNIKKNPAYSFIMKDDVLKYSLKWLQKLLNE